MAEFIVLQLTTLLYWAVGLPIVLAICAPAVLAISIWRGLGISGIVAMFRRLIISFSKAWDEIAAFFLP